jgi:hypothetical protein
MSYWPRTTGCDVNKRVWDLATAVALGLAVCRAPLTANAELHGGRHGAGARAAEPAAPPREVPADDAVVAAASDDGVGYIPPRCRAWW